MGDIDGDGLIEMVLGLTDRVVRSYRWINTPGVNSYSPSTSQMNVSQEVDNNVLGMYYVLTYS